MAELVLNNFASAIIHSAVLPQYPVRGVEETIRFHLRPEPRPKGFPHGKLRPIPACRPGPNLPEERTKADAARSWILLLATCAT
jgi:hypothetical protein